MDTDYEDCLTNHDDAAEEFVATFYHDPDEEVDTDEEEGNLFDLYHNSRPSSPLLAGERGQENVKQNDPQERQRSSDVTPVEKGADLEELQWHATTTGRTPLVHEPNLPAKDDLASQLSADQTSQGFEATKDLLDI